MHRVVLMGCAPASLIAGVVRRDPRCQIVTWDDGAGSALPQVRPDLAVVAGPLRMRAALACAALRAGAHVYIQPPVCATPAESRVLREAALVAGRVVQVGFHRRFSPARSSGFKFLRSGRIGEVQIARAFAHHYCQQQRCEFVHADELAAHWLDEILCWSGCRTPVQAHATRAGSTRVVTWEFDGFTAVWEQRVFTGAEVERTETGVDWFGSGGVLRSGWADGGSFTPNCAGKPIRSGKPGDADEQCVQASWTEFLQAVRGGRTARCGLAAGLNVTELLLLA